MAIFISYSHSDKDFVDTLAAHLVKARANVWIDRWELKIGDSITQKVQGALTSASALLIVLSKASVSSEWCKREITSGLLREVEEKRVIAMPILIEECDIPLFLRDKMYADFRSDFEEGLHSVLSGIAAVNNSEQSRLSTKESTVDWAEDWKFQKGLFTLRYTIIDHRNDVPMTFLIEVIVICNEVASKRYKEFEAAGIGWVGRAVISEALFDVGSSHDMRAILEDSSPVTIDAQVSDSTRSSTYTIHASCRKLGDDNGSDQLVDVGAYLAAIRDFVRSASRPPNAAEREAMARIMSTPWPSAQSS